MASPEGLEPPTSDLEGRCSIQLSYGLCGPGEAERWMVGAAGFELATYWSQTSETNKDWRGLDSNLSNPNLRILPRYLAASRSPVRGFSAGDRTESAGDADYPEARNGSQERWPHSRPW